jgi:very-short-patch-repair endonuclease
MPRTLQQLQEFKKSLELNATKSELKLHAKLTELGYKFKFQHIIQPFIADFYFPKQKVIIELDGKIHNKIYDASRDLYLNNAGYSRIYRIKSYRVFKELDKVINEIDRFLKGEDVIVVRKKRTKKS